MKKILLTLTIALSATFSYAQKRTIDWSVETIVAPTVVNSNNNNNSPFDYDIVVKNNGADSVFAGDTITYQFLITLGQNAFFFPSPNSFFFRIAQDTILPGDTMHISGNQTFVYYVDFSYNATFAVASSILNRKANGVTSEGAGTNANNQKTSTIAWMNKHGWGVSVNDVHTSNLSVYPNPANGIISVSPAVLMNGQMDVSVVDMSGRVIFTQTFQSGDVMTINTENFEKGMYVVQVKNGDLISSSKISIQ